MNLKNKTEMSDAEAWKIVDEMLSDPKITNELRDILVVKSSQWAIENGEGKAVADLAAGFRQVLKAYCDSLPETPDARAVLLALDYTTDNFAAAFTATMRIWLR